MTLLLQEIGPTEKERNALGSAEISGTEESYSGLLITTESGQYPGEIDCRFDRGRVRFGGLVKHLLCLVESAGGREQSAPPGEYHRVVGMTIKEGRQALLGGADLAARSRDTGELHMCFDGLGVEANGLFEFGSRECYPPLSQKLIAGPNMLPRGFGV